MRFINGEGPVPCDLMFIGERPGKEEHAYGRPFVGKSGKELDRYLWDALHRHRSSVYVTNLVKDWAPGDRDPSPEEVERDRKTLEDEIESVRPDYVVTLGRFSTRYLLGDVDMEVVHGLPKLVRDFVVVPVYHPAAGLHSTEFQGLIAWDFDRLAQTVKGEIEPIWPEDEHPETDYVESRTYFNLSPTAVDTEGSIKKPWCLTATSHPGSSTCVRGKGAGERVAFRHVLLHNSMHDLGVLRAMGAKFESFDDTMVMAYELCLEPQGLKALAKRHCGMEMDSYDELVGPYRLEKQLNWLIEAWAWLNNRLTSDSGVQSQTVVKRAGTRKSAGKKSGKTSRKTTGSRKS